MEYRFEFEIPTSFKLTFPLIFDLLWSDCYLPVPLLGVFSLFLAVNSAVSGALIPVLMKNYRN